MIGLRGFIFYSLGGAFLGVLSLGAAALIEIFGAWFLGITGAEDFRLAWIGLLGFLGLVFGAFEAFGKG